MKNATGSTSTCKGKLTSGKTGPHITSNDLTTIHKAEEQMEHEYPQVVQSLEENALSHHNTL
eukprot:2694873-Prorocentrum_lima.AAC.1